MLSDSEASPEWLVDGEMFGVGATNPKVVYEVGGGGHSQRFQGNSSLAFGFLRMTKDFMPCSLT